MVRSVISANEFRGFGRVGELAGNYADGQPVGRPYNIVMRNQNLLGIRLQPDTGKTLYKPNANEPARFAEAQPILPHLKPEAPVKGHKCFLGAFLSFFFSFLQKRLAIPN